MSSTRSERRYRAKMARKALLRDRKFVHMGELPDGYTPVAHPDGGIIIVHPDHEPVWWKPDGTKTTIKIVD
jgi:hypothetical protein